MIQIMIKADKDKIFDKFTKVKVVLSDVILVLHAMELIKKELLEIKFDSDFEIEERE